MNPSDPSLLFAAAFLIGTALGVRVLIRGVERPSRDAPADVDDFGRVRETYRISLFVPVLAAALTTFGAVGVVLLRAAGVSPARATVAAAAAMLGAAIVTGRLVPRWARRAAAEAAVDPRYALQGHLARIRSVGADGTTGEVEYTANGRQVVATARSLDGSPLQPGLDVVIDRLEDGVVYVEPWGRVEERL